MAGSPAKTQNSTKLSTNDKISRFIAAISSKNYAEANKYLKGAVEDKITSRINNATEQPLF